MVHARSILSPTAEVCFAEVEACARSRGKRVEGKGEGQSAHIVA